MTAAPKKLDALTQDPTGLVRKRFDFYSLPRAVQDRFLASAGGRGIPEVLVFNPLARNSGAAWFVFSGVAFLGAIGLSVLGFGQLGSAHAIQPLWYVAAYAALGAAIAIGVSSALWIGSRQRRFPFRLGEYLFPCGVFVAHDEHLELYPLTELKNVGTGEAGTAKLTFESRTFEFALPKGLELASFAAQLEQHRLRYSKASAEYNRKELSALDPVRDTGFSNPLSSKEAIVRPADVRPTRFALGAGIGLLLGSGVFFARNTLAERALYLEARRVNTAAGYRAYLDQGGARADAAELLLPRAELAAAVGSLASVEAYAEQRENSKIWPEIEAALRTELLNELDRVSKQGTLAAIAAFKTEHPRSSLIEKEIALARAAVFSRAKDSFASSTGASGEVLRLAQALLTHSDAKGPRVDIRFRRHLPKSAERADSAIRRSAYYGGASSLPSQYFSGEHSLRRENAAAEEFAARLQPLFPRELVEFRAGEHSDGEGEPPPSTVPTLFVSYATEMSGGYTTERPRGVYVGLGMMLRAEFMMPDGGRFLPMKDSSWLPPDINEISREGLGPEQVYDRNARLGLTRFVEKYLTTALSLRPRAAAEQAAERLAPTAPPAPPAPVQPAALGD